MDEAMAGSSNSFSLIGRAEGACLSAFRLSAPCRKMHDDSDLTGFLPFSLIFCLLIYGRQKKPNYATHIFLTQGKMAGRAISPVPTYEKRVIFLIGKVRIGP